MIGVMCRSHFLEFDRIVRISRKFFTQVSHYRRKTSLGGSQPSGSLAFSFLGLCGGFPFNPLKLSHV